LAPRSEMTAPKQARAPAHRVSDAPSHPMTYEDWEDVFAMTEVFRNEEIRETWSPEQCRRWIRWINEGVPPAAPLEDEHA